jgi:hypothetical protein
VIVELRRYTLLPGRRDELIDLFDREFVESQEELGMAVLGQFRDLDRPDRFVWLRGFADMTARRHGLRSFYGGPVWRQHGPAANATMIDFDDVLLLRTIVSPTSSARPSSSALSRPSFPSPTSSPSSLSSREGDRPDSVLRATIWFRDRPFDTDFEQWFAGRDAVAAFSTEYAENDFPALPVREGEHAFVWFTGDGGDDVEVPERFGVVRTERLRLAPTTRSALR